MPYFSECIPFTLLVICLTPNTSISEASSKKASFSVMMKKAYANLLITFGDIKRYKKVRNFLIARLVYNDALITVFALGGIYASVTIGFTFEEILFLGIILNLLAGLGAFLFGIVDDKIEAQISRTRTTEEGSPKNTTLYFSLLLETKDLLSATTGLLEEYHTEYDSSVKPAKISDDGE